MEDITYLEPVVEEEGIELEEDAAIISNKNTCNTQCGSESGTNEVTA